MVTRAVSAAGTLAVAMTLAAGLLPVAAMAAPPATDARLTTQARSAVSGQARSAVSAEAPKPATGPNSVQITGRFPGGRILVSEQDDPGMYRQLLAEVSWLAGAAPQTEAPRVNKLGPKFTLLVLAKNAPQQTYDVYPLAAGGPRAYRPAKQPQNHKVKAGWFYGQLTMAETLRVSGVPLTDRGKAITGGIGGGQRVNRGPELDPAANVTELLTNMRQLVLLNGAVALTIALGLALISFLIRRKV